MVPYWKRVPITAPPVLLELDPTNMDHGIQVDKYCRFEGSMCDCIKRCFVYPMREDPFDFYEDALGG